MTRILKLASIAAAVAAVAPRAASALTATSSMQVTATVIPACIINSSNLDFGNYDPNLTSPTQGNTTIQLTCTKSTGYSVALTSANAFAMKNGTESLNYGLYSDSGRSSAWNGTSAVTGTAATKAVFTLNVYGSIPAGQDVSTGSPSGNVSSGKVYTDTVTATVTF